MSEEIDSQVEQLKQIMVNSNKDKKTADTARVASEELEFDLKVSEVMPTGLDALDTYIGGGLYPCHTYELAAAESGGKSTLLDCMMASYHKHDGVVVRVESESTWDKMRAKLMGVDLDKTLVLRPRSLEEGIENLSKTIKKIRENLPKTPVFIVWDTITAAPTAQGIANFLNPDKAQAEAQNTQARKIRQFLDNVTPIMTHTRLTLMLVSQVYSDRDAQGWSPTEGWIIKGGQGPAHYSSLTLFLSRGYPIRNEREIITGYNVRINIAKNKQSPWEMSINTVMHQEYGFLNVETLFEQIKQYKLIHIASNGWAKYSLAGEERSFRTSEFSAHLEKYPDIVEYFNYVLTNFVAHTFITMAIRYKDKLDAWKLKYGDVIIPAVIKKEKEEE